jgi:HEAT repeat protein
MSFKYPFALLLGMVLVATTASPQEQPRQSRRQTSARPSVAISVEEATQLTNGWALLAEGLFERAAAKAAQVLAAYPRSGAALQLALEAQLARSGAPAALDQYERWLGARTIEEPAALRRVASAMLREATTLKSDPAARIEALRALADDGDARAAGELAQVASKGQGAGARAVASTGDERATDTLLADLNTGLGNPTRTIGALGASGDKRAIAPLVQRLKDPRQEVRGAVVDALGKVGDAETAAVIAPLLSDTSLHVRVRTAGALLRLGDYSGLPILQELMASESPAMRLDAAEALASRPDSAWMGLVTELARDPDPEIRAAAGRLMAPHDPEMARGILASLMSDENPAIRELASRGLGEALSDDLPTLRRLMKTGHSLSRVRAAARVLILTR